MYTSIAALSVAIAGFASAQSSTAMMSSMQSSVMMSASVPTNAIAATSASASQIITNTVSVPDESATSYPVNPASIPQTQRNEWCAAQQNSCFQICDSRPAMNRCERDTLEWTCTCQGTTPDISNFNQTIPFFLCQTYQQNCVAATDNAETQRQCLALQCGGPVLPENYASAGTMSATAAMASMSGMSTSTAGSDSDSDSASSTAGNAGNSSPASTIINLGLGVFAATVAFAALAL